MPPNILKKCRSRLIKNSKILGFGIRDSNYFRKVRSPLLKTLEILGFGIRDIKYFRKKSMPTPKNTNSPNRNLESFRFSIE